MDNLSGQSIKGYELQEQIGAGGFGAVYRASQPLLKRIVAVKVILPKHANDPDFIRRFELEAELVARLEHPHIIPLYDYWREPNGAFLIMRWLSGGSLRDSLLHDTWDLQRTAKMLDEITAALAISHRNGVIHRDIKPDNILLDDDGNTYLADFGIAKSPEIHTATDQGALGTIAYAAPEQIQGLSVTPQTDIYALGLVLFEVLTGKYPFADSGMQNVIYKHLYESVPDISNQFSPEMDHVVQQATAKSASDRFLDVRDLAEAFRQAIDLPSKPTSSIPQNVTLGEMPDTPTLIEIDDIQNPYKGLRPFREADAGDFYGRDALVQQLLERLTSDNDLHRFLAVVGPSGSGKSSAIRAGLVPALHKGMLTGSEKWFITEMFPGQHPFAELEAALLRVAINPPTSLLEQLKGEDGFGRAVKRILPADDDSELLLVVDQFEELFTLVEDEEIRTQFLDNLHAALNDVRGRLRVIVTLRADFYDRPLQYRDFGELLRKRTEIVLPLSQAELEAAILRPAEAALVTLEPGLAHTIINDVGEQPGTLPLLQYALTELFERRDGRIMTQVAYRDIGGVVGALAKRAEDIYTSLDEVGQDGTQQLFLRLVTLGDGTEDTRRRVRLSELSSLSDGMGAVIDAYGESRLLTFDRDPMTREPTVEVAHEALIRSWEGLRDWLDADREGLRLHRRLTQAATEWRDSGFDSGFLARETRLTQFESLINNPTFDLNRLEEEFLGVSVEDREQRKARDEARKEHEFRLQRQATNRMYYVVAVLALFLVSAIGLSLFALDRAETALIAQSESQSQAETAIAAQETSAYNEELAGSQATIAYENLIEAQNVQALFLADLAQQELIAGRPQIALQLGIESFNMREDGVVNYESRQALFNALLRVGNQVGYFLHDDVVGGARWNTEESQLLTWSDDGTAKVWDVATGELRFTVRHSDRVTSARWNTEESELLTRSSDGTARIWDAATGELRFTPQHDDRVSGARWNIDGSQLLTWSTDGTAKVWNAATGDLHITAQHDDRVSGARWNADESQLLSWSTNGTAKVWDVATGELRFTAQHDDWVMSARWNDNENKLFTWSDDRTAKVWDATTGELLFTAQHQGWIDSARWNNDGSQLLTRSTDETASVWDVANGELLFIVQHSDWITSMKWNTEGSQLLSWSWDGTAKIWDVTTGELLFIAQHDSKVIGARWNTEESQLLTWSDDGIVKVWDATTGELHFTAQHDDAVKGTTWNTEGSQLLTWSDDGTAKVWDATTGELSFTAQHDSIVGGAGWNADESRLLTWSDDGTVKIWDVNSIARYDDWVNASWNTDGGQLLIWSDDGTVKVWSQIFGELPFTSQNNVAGSAIWNRNETLVLTRSDDGTAKVWDMATSELRFTAQHDDRVSGMNWNTDGSLVLTRSDDGTAKVWDMATSELRFTAQHDDRVSGARWNIDGSQLLTWSDDGTAKVWNAATGDLHITAQHDDRVSGARWNADESQLLSWSTDGTAKVWDVATGELRFTAQHDDWVMSARWNTEESQLVTLSQEGAKVWDTESGDLRFIAQHNRAISATWSADGSHLSTWSDDGTVKVWDIATGELHFAPQHDDYVFSPTWSTDGSHLSTWSGDGTVKVWDIATGELHFAPQHDDYVFSPTWSADGSQLLSRSDDGTAKVWDVATGELYFTARHDDRITGTRWNADESQLLTWSTDGTVKVWDTSTSELRLIIRYNTAILYAHWSADENHLLTWSDDGIVQSWLLDFDQVLAIAEEKVIPELLTNEDREQFFLPTLTPSATPFANGS